jgi:F-type H+-transporting ATPase subunit epsilon
MEVLPDRVTILADSCDRSDEIDLERAEDARRSAEERIAQRKSDQDLALAEADLRRSLMQIRVAQARKAKNNA